MTAKIDGNQNAPQPTALRGPAPMTKAPPTAAQLQVKADKAFDSQFAAAPTFTPVSDDAQPFAQMTPQEQISLWSGIVHSPLMGAASKEKPGEGFVFHNSQTTSPTNSEVLKLTSSPGTTVTPALEHALGKLNDAMVSRQLSDLTDKIKLLSATASGMKAINPKVAAEIRATLIAPMGKQIRSSLGKSASADSIDTGTGSAGAGATGTGTGTDAGAASTLNFGPLAKYINSQGAGMDVGGMDIDSLVEMTIMQCGQDSELDLREIAGTMQKNLNMSKALRSLKDQQAADAAHMKSVVDNEYLDLTTAKPPATKPLIDPAKCSQSQFENWRGVNLVPPTIDDSVDPPKVNYTPPSLSDPSPLNDIDIPQSFKPGATADQTATATGAQKDLTDAKNQETLAQKAVDAAQAQLQSDGKGAATYTADAQALSDAQAKLSTATDNVTTAQAAFSAADSDVKGSAPTDSSNGGTGAAFTTTAAELAPSASWINDTQTRLDDQSDISQQMQLKLQMAQQAYTQAQQMVSNIMKTDNDTKSAIVKNLAG